MITFTFDADIIQIITDYFVRENIQCEIADLDTMLFRFYNFNSRLIQIRPRNVGWSRELAATILDEEAITALQEIERKFKEGEDLNPHLSKRLSKPDYSDPLFCDLGIQHLHFYPRPARSLDLLFCFVSEDTVYFIDVMSHNHWSEERLFEILCHNWPSLLASSEIRGALGVSDQITSEKVKTLRKAHFNILRECNGKVYTGLGTQMTRSGHSIAGVRGAMAISHELMELKRHFQNQEGEIRDAICQVTGQAPPQNLHFGLRREGAELLVREIQTETRMFAMPTGWRLSCIG